MLVVDALERLVRLESRLPLGAFTALLNDRVSAMWERARWPHYVVEAAVSATHSFSNLTITNGVTQATVVDGAAQGLFESLHVGKAFTIEGVAYSVASVTDGDTLVLSGLYDFDGGSNPESGTLPRVRLSLPTTFSRLYSPPVPTSLASRYPEHPDFGLRDPEDYRLAGPTSEGYSLEFFRVLQEAHTVRYIRRPTAATGPGSTVDISAGMERALVVGLLADLLPRVEARNEIELAQFQSRARTAMAQYEDAVRHAVRSERGLSLREGRNRPWGF